jgi:hypothetical protein
MAFIGTGVPNSMSCPPEAVIYNRQLDLQGMLGAIGRECDHRYQVARERIECPQELLDMQWWMMTTISSPISASPSGCKT